MARVAIVAKVTIREGRTGEYLAGFARLLEQAEREPGTLFYTVSQSADVTVGETLLGKGLLA
jgi:quinol monooxygenase YgiN